MLFGLAAIDIATFGQVVLVVACVSALACAVPTTRVARLVRDASQGGVGRARTRLVTGLELFAPRKGAFSAPACWRAPSAAHGRWRSSASAARAFRALVVGEEGIPGRDRGAPSSPTLPFLHRLALDGVIRAWSVVCTTPGAVSLTVIHEGDPAIYTFPAVNVVIGTNRFANANIEIRAGDRIGFQSNAEPNTYQQQLGANVTSLDFEIDREGTFIRVHGGP